MDCANISIRVSVGDDKALLYLYRMYVIGSFHTIELFLEKNIDETRSVSAYFYRPTGEYSYLREAKIGRIDYCEHGRRY